MESLEWEALLTNHKNFYRIQKDSEATAYLDALKSKLNEDDQVIWWVMTYTTWKAEEDQLRVNLSQGSTTADQAVALREKIDRDLMDGSAPFFEERQETDPEVNLPTRILSPS